MSDPKIRADVFCALLKELARFATVDVCAEAMPCGLLLDGEYGEARVRIDEYGALAASDPMKPDELLTLAAWALACIPDDWRPE